MDIKAMIRKEIMDGLRNYRFLILLAGILFFAIFDPVMNKLVLPELLKSQFPNMTEEVMQGMLITTQNANIRAYLGDVFQISTLIIAFALSGIMAQEISDKTLIFPICSGKSYSGLLLAKLSVYGSVLVISSIFSAMVNYVYAGALFGFDLPSFMPVLRAGLFQGFYMVYVLALLIFIGSLVKKPVTAGLLVLIPAYGTRIMGDLLNINRYLPSGLLVEAEMLAVIPSVSWIGSLVSTLAVMVLLIGFTMIRLTKIELL
ncbi:hypothetical protein [Candidatus Contubernalis alkaliaceticus]|uniref:hypothetical protein n=1 Tax=Candidatus Contubernalis alkaliaceticus TaxID=338645 RepID=UPI001F4C1A93|nr:hypothetical protein [Candidatus Contubernalis alkalaceticus]UNC92196.1 hypothetical protein HUE98_08890 [Candidatus Contubernalis alkalaceticus]